MSKKLAMISIVSVFFIVGFAFLGGQDKETTAASEENQSGCQKQIQTICPKTLDSSHNGTCGLKTDQACPPDCKMECCAAKKKAGTCPLKSSTTNCPKTCPKKSDTL